MLRKIIIPNEEKLVIDLPKNYIGEEIEILVFPVSFNEETVKPIGSKIDFSLFDKYEGIFDGNFNRESCYDRKVFS